MATPYIDDESRPKQFQYQGNDLPRGTQRVFMMLLVELRVQIHSSRLMLSRLGLGNSVLAAFYYLAVLRYLSAG